MDILRNLFGTVTSGIVRLLVTVGVLAAAYFFVLKPVLSTTEKTFKETNQTIQKSFGKDANLGDISKTMDDVNKQVQVQIERSFHTAKKDGNPERLLHCIQRAHNNVQKIKRCTRKF